MAKATKKSTKLKKVSWDKLPPWHKVTKEYYEKLNLPTEVYPNADYSLPNDLSCEMGVLLEPRPIIVTQFKNGKALQAYPSFIMYTVADCLDYHSALNQVTNGKKPLRKKKPKPLFEEPPTSAELEAESKN